MHSLIRPEELDVLIWEISSTPHTRRLLDLGMIEPAVARFADCRALVTFLHAGSAGQADKDLVLEALVRAHACDRDPRWRSVLLAAFWPGLESLLLRRSRWDQDPDEVWQELVITFLEVLCRLDLARRRERFAQKIINDTIHRFHDRFQRRWRLEARETLMPPADLPRLSDAGSELERQEARIHLSELQARGMAFLERLVSAGAIDATDSDLLAGTYLQNLTLAEVAQRIGITVEGAKKRRQRIEAALCAENSTVPCPLNHGLRGLLLAETEPGVADRDRIINACIRALTPMTNDCRSMPAPASTPAPAPAKAPSATAAFRQLCLAAVVRHPGLTSAEIAEHTGLDRHTVSRRLPELRRVGIVANGMARVCTVTKWLSATWIPTQEAQS